MHHFIGAGDIIGVGFGGIGAVIWRRTLEHIIAHNIVIGGVIRPTCRNARTSALVVRIKTRVAMVADGETTNYTMRWDWICDLVLVRGSPSADFETITI